MAGFSPNPTNQLHPVRPVQIKIASWKEGRWWNEIDCEEQRFQIDKYMAGVINIWFSTKTQFSPRKGETEKNMYSVGLIRNPSNTVRKIGFSGRITSGRFVEL